MLAIELFYMILGGAMIYSWIHFSYIQFVKDWEDRNLYEKIVTIFAIATMFLYVAWTI